MTVPNPAPGRRRAVLSFIAALSGFGVFGIIRALARHLARGCLPHCGGKGEWWTVAVLAGAAVSFCWVVWRVYVAHWTTVGPDGVRVPGLVRARVIPWREFTRAGVVGDEVVLERATGERLAVPFRAYADAEALARYVQARVPEEVSTSIGGGAV